MLRSALLAVVALGAAAAPAYAAPCRDAHGKFVKCPTTAAAPKATRCRDVKGHFTKCGAPGAKPM